MRLYRFNIQANLILLLILSQLRSFPAPNSPCVLMRPHQVALSNKQSKWGVDSPFFPPLLKSTIEDLQELNKTEYRKVAWERMIRPIRYAWKKKKKHTSILKKEISRGKKSNNVAQAAFNVFFGYGFIWKRIETGLCFLKTPTNDRSNAQGFKQMKRPQAFWA